LVVNDHVLKAAFPGLLTGKLSDVAGLVVAAPLLATLGSLCVRRLPPNRVAVGSVVVARHLVRPAPHTRGHPHSGPCR